MSGGLVQNPADNEMQNMSSVWHVWLLIYVILVQMIRVLKCQHLLISLREEVRETHMITELQTLVHCQHEVALEPPGVSFVTMLKLLPVHVCLFRAGRSGKSFSYSSTPPSASSQNSHCFLKWYTKLFFFCCPKLSTVAKTNPPVFLHSVTSLNQVWGQRIAGDCLQETT